MHLIDFKIALRTFWRNRLYTFLNFTGLSVGLSASVLILLWVQNERSFDGYHEKSEQIFRVTNTLVKQDPPWIWSNSPYVLGGAAQLEIPGVEKVTRFSPYIPTSVFKIGDKYFEEKKIAQVDSNWFDFFRYSFIAGNESALREPNALVLTESKAETWFGDADPIGKVVRMGKTDLVVRGVVKDNPANSSFQFNVLVPVSAIFQDENYRSNASNWRNFNYQLFLRLKSGTSLSQVKSQINRFYTDNRKDSSIVASLIPLKDIHFDNSFQSDPLVKGNMRTVLIMGVIGVLILVIASINFVNLTTALASKRAREVGLKKMIGAGRGTLFGQFLGESVIQILFAILGALLIINLVLPVFNDFTDKKFVLEYNNGLLWLLLLGGGFATLLLAGVYPSILLSSLKPVSLVKSNSPKSANSYFRQSLVVVQFTISLILVIGTICIDRQLHFMQTQDPGYKREHVFTFSVPSSEKPEQSAGGLKYIIQNIQGLTAVKGVATANTSIINIGISHSGSLKWAGKADDYVPSVNTISAGEELPAMLGMKLKEGRWLENNRKADTANVVLNETAVKTFGLKSPVVGQWFGFQGRRGQIVGVAKDFHFKSFHEKIAPLVMDNDAYWQREILVKTSGANASEVLAEVGKIWTAQFPDKPFAYQFLDEQYNKLYKSEQQAVQLFKSFAGIAILISCLGLFGLATFTAQNRIREIGIRKVLGATVYGIVSLLSKDFLKLVMISLFVAIPVANYFMGKWLQGFEYRIEIQWWIFALAGILAVGIAMITVSFQSVKAALMNPVKTLRSE
jgi:ABC-type antimicrobial peptide transport system permease subunit